MYLHKSLSSYGDKAKKGNDNFWGIPQKDVIAFSGFILVRAEAIVNSNFPARRFSVVHSKILRPMSCTSIHIASLFK